MLGDKDWVVLSGLSGPKVEKRPWLGAGLGGGEGGDAMVLRRTRVKKFGMKLVQSAAIMDRSEVSHGVPGASI